MRTIGVTAGATEPERAIWPRLSMYCMLSRSARMSHGLCSISYTMPSYLAVAIAIALSGSAWQNDVNVGLPDSRALITLLRRGSSAMLFPLGAFGLRTINNASLRKEARAGECLRGISRFDNGEARFVASRRERGRAPVFSGIPIWACAHH